MAGSFAPPDGSRVRTATAVLLVLALAGVSGDVSAAAAIRAKVNTFTVSGKYHGTLTIPNPSRDCTINDYKNPHLSDSVNLYSITGVLSGLPEKSWSFLATEPKQGTFVTTKTNQATSAKLRPSNPNDTVGFSQTSGTIKFDGKAGSVNLKMVYDNGIAATVTVTVIGNWSCPVVNHI
jgi:hypothetical protein